MAKPNKPTEHKTRETPEPAEQEHSHMDRAPRQKNSDRDPVKSAEETRDVPTQHGTLK